MSDFVCLEFDLHTHTDTQTHTHTLEGWASAAYLWYYCVKSLSVSPHCYYSFHRWAEWAAVLLWTRTETSTSLWLKQPAIIWIHQHQVHQFLTSRAADESVIVALKQVLKSCTSQQFTQLQSVSLHTLSNQDRERHAEAVSSAHGRFIQPKNSGIKERGKESRRRTEGTIAHCKSDRKSAKQITALTAACFVFYTPVFRRIKQIYDLLICEI